jgi:multidrug efflux pump subunit AcrA (membrane-fusion protein)
LQAVLAESSANLDKLIAGPTAEDLQVSKTKVQGAVDALSNANQYAVDALHDAYTKSDDAIRNDTDQFFQNPRGTSPTLTFVVLDSQLKQLIEASRLSLEDMLTKWQFSLDGLRTSSDLYNYGAAAQSNLLELKTYLDRLSLAVNSLMPISNLSQATIDGWKLSVSTARGNISTAVAEVTDAMEKIKSADSSLKLSSGELALKEAGTRPEDIAIARANVAQAESQIASIKDKINKSYLYSPGSAQVMKVPLEEKEIFQLGEIAISLSTSGYKLQSDISELDIGKISAADGNNVTIKLDAFPDAEFQGRLVSVEPQQIVKEGDIYYRINVNFEADGQVVRPGMSADLTIYAASKENILLVPEIAVYKKNGTSYIKVQTGSVQKEVEIQTGISDGEHIEIVKGLAEGDVIVVPTEQ